MTSTDPKTGLTAAEAAKRAADGLSNKVTDVSSKSAGRIFRDNFITLFNIINYILAAIVIAVGSYKNALFIIIIFANILIGTVQELRAKKALEKLRVLSARKAHVVRDGELVDINTEDVVLGDMIEFSTGNQICADCIVRSGGIEADESLLTGEADPVQKHDGDTLYSGSFVVSGQCRACADKVGSDSFAAKISHEAKAFKGGNSEIMSALKKIIKTVSFVIVPAGLLLFLKQYLLLHSSVENAVVNAVAAMIGMIPEGLILLSSVVMALGVIRLSRHKTLVQELYGIEALARVDVLCLDKTGTITEGNMRVRAIEPIGGGDPVYALSRIAAALPDKNPTADAVRKYMGDISPIKADISAPFSSARKWSGVYIDGDGSYIMGAADYILTPMPDAIAGTVSRLAADGSRVVLVAKSSSPLSENSLPDHIVPVGFVVIRDSVRKEAPETLKFFAEQGVEVKVISGDDPKTVSAIACEAGLAKGSIYVDAHAVPDDELLSRAEETGVFGRVSPSQKRDIIKALRSKGHTVAMMGDGVNDVLALKEADCSISVAAGSDAARNISQMVLLDSNFSAMYKVVMEGRRAINNIERSASLFLVKTIFSFLLAVVFVFLPWSYPFIPIQLTLISALTIGVPSFVLALEPNRDRISGDFMFNILKRAVPGALTVFCDIIITMLLSIVFRWSPEQISTVFMILTAISGLAVLFFTCRPFNALRASLLALMTAAFITAVLAFGWFFSVTPLTAPMAITVAVLGAAVFPLMLLLRKVVTLLERNKEKIGFFKN